MKIPYSSQELCLAFLSLQGKKVNKKISDKKMKEIECELGGFPKDRRDLNKKITEYHGISLEQLINSPNYKVLCQEYQEYMVCQLVKKIAEKFNVTDKEVWAVAVLALGLI